jgi:hypothetical protein
MVGCLELEAVPEPGPRVRFAVEDAGLAKEGTRACRATFPLVDDSRAEDLKTTVGVRFSPRCPSDEMLNGQDAENPPDCCYAGERGVIRLSPEIRRRRRLHREKPKVRRISFSWALAVLRVECRRWPAMRIPGRVTLWCGEGFRQHLHNPAFALAGLSCRVWVKDGDKPKWKV